jgi:hypothetical protein
MNIFKRNPKPKEQEFDFYHKDKEKFKSIIDRVVTAKSGSDLKILLDENYEFQWRDKGRMMYILGLLQGALMQFNKEVSIKELEEFSKL